MYLQSILKQFFDSLDGDDLPYNTHNRLTAFVQDNPGRPVPEETLTHSHPS